jgi:hypothetical protein
MILYFDEDMGKSVPVALFTVGLKTILWKLKRYGGPRTKVPDTQWLTDAGRYGWLAISCNTEILNVETERDTIQNEKVGITFLTSGQENAPDILRLILNKWKWLEAIDTQILRPFVYTMRIDGHFQQIPIAPLRKRRRRL